MYTIEDIISSYLHATGILKEYPDCLLLILKPEEINDIEQLKGLQAEIETPNGKKISRHILGSEVNHSVVGVYVANSCKEEIPRLSKITWNKSDNKANSADAKIRAAD